MIRVLAFLICLVSAGAAERWELQYFYDEDRSSFTINDLQFPSPRHGIAVGYITEKRKSRPAALVTHDGRKWSLEPLKDFAASIFFLDDNVGWMVGPKIIWQTDDGGRNWRKLATLPDVLRVYFLDRQHGFAVAAHKAIYESRDGGKEWSRVTVSRESNTNPEYTYYGWIAFADKQTGMIAGWSRPPRRTDERLPEWLDPEAAVLQRELPTLSLLLDTRDGGKTWTSSSASMFGRISKVRLLPDRTGIGLIEFLDAFEWPSEVFRIDWETGKSTRIFRQRDRAVTDLALVPGGTAYLAAVESLSKLRNNPVPGKVKMLKSDDFSNWTEMDVDYRAIAHRLTLAAPEAGNIWAATDTGMILKLVR